ncbi:MAG: hypothetical protein DRO99_04575 [Candidatus Aenigmatarchaeota archaeon]|nr:MAG: hypothetical protein DRO99_04575 [Candidatus Aenigmarchaeota archaeon]
MSYLWCWLLLPLIKAVWACLCAIGRAIRNRRHVEPEAPLPASPATKHKAPTKLDIVREESVSGLVSMGETRKMAEMRVDNVMAEHPELDATEDVIKAVFQAQ